MKIPTCFMAGAVAITLCVLGTCEKATAQSVPPQGDSKPRRIVRLAELEIYPAQIEAYQAALKQKIRASIAREPGVLTLFAVSVKGKPTHIRLFEMYADTAAYKAHLQTPHFKTYKVGTQKMIRSLNLVETDPILLGAKPSVGDFVKR